MIAWREKTKAFAIHFLVTLAFRRAPPRSCSWSGSQPFP